MYLLSFLCPTFIPMFLIGFPVISWPMYYFQHRGTPYITVSFLAKRTSFGSFCSSLFSWSLAHGRHKNASLLKSIASNMKSFVDRFKRRHGDTTYMTSFSKRLHSHDIPKMVIKKTTRNKRGKKDVLFANKEVMIYGIPRHP